MSCAETDSGNQVSVQAYTPVWNWIATVSDTHGFRIKQTVASGVSGVVSVVLVVLGLSEMLLT